MLFTVAIIILAGLEVCWYFKKEIDKDRKLLFKLKQLDR
jgi:hypothetical protein